MFLRRKLTVMATVALLSTSLLAGCSSSGENSNGGSNGGGTATAAEVLANKNARAAISMIIDKQAYCDVILNNGSIPTSTSVSYTHLDVYKRQTIGRAARNSEGKVIMYADKITRSMESAIAETKRRREIQMLYNEEHNITPTTIKKKVRDAIEATVVADEETCLLYTSTTCQQPR